jgi:hypothetical protein
MKNPPDDPELLRYSEEHLMHELSMMRETASELPKNKAGTTLYTALLESFATHVRNLIEFLFFEISKDYVRALHFFDQPADWPHRMTADWTILYKRACNEVNHLTTDRIDGTPAGKKWPVRDIIAKFELILKEFAAKASPKKLHDKVREFLALSPDKILLWIGDNVAHPNVAVVALIVASFPPSPARTNKP